MTPDPNNIDPAKDLKVWIPIPRKWDSQKAAKIISVQAAENKQQHAHVYEAIDKLRNRLPAWATMLIAALTAIIGLLGGLAL